MELGQRHLPKGLREGGGIIRRRGLACAQFGEEAAFSRVAMQRRGVHFMPRFDQAGQEAIHVGRVEFLAGEDEQGGGFEGGLAVVADLEGPDGLGEVVLGKGRQAEQIPNNCGVGMLLGGRFESCGALVGEKLVPLVKGL